MLVTTRERKWWTKSEDEVLQTKARLQIDKHGSVINWSDVASELPGRSNKDCRKRWYKVRLDIRRGAWCPEEDEKLHKAVAEAGLKWTAVSQIMQTRNADQCAKRWQHVLGPDIKHTPWTPKEDKILQNAIAKYGNNWKQVGLLELPGRSAHDIRNRSVALSRRSRRSSAATQQPTEPSTAFRLFSPTPSTDLSESGKSIEEYGGDNIDVATGHQSCTSSVDIGFYTGTEGGEDWALPDLPSILDNTMSEDFSPNWEIPSPIDPLLSLATPPHDPSTPFWESATSQDLQMSNVELQATGMFDEECLDQVLDPNLQSKYTPSSAVGGGSRPQQACYDADVPNSNTPTLQTTNGESNCVTVVLRRADAELTQEVIGNLMGLNANLTIHVIKD
ncbi:hypothetical protein GGR58DRAFT_463784 [Xylaria digitata]|nr:hypothetical protein GGR58DRAFT_463784 [Xylaria digitata]